MTTSLQTLRNRANRNERLAQRLRESMQEWTHGKRPNYLERIADAENTARSCRQQIAAAAAAMSTRSGE